MVNVVFASARPVTLEIIAFALALCFTSLQIFTDGRPMAAPTGAIIRPFCHSENGKIPKTSAENNRAVTIWKRTILMRIGRLPRPSIARPVLGARPIRIKNGAYRSTILEHRIIVGASIARPPAGWRKAIRV